MAEKAKAWTETEKLELVFQIIEKAGPIPWDDLKLPPGRTKKGCSVMIDREKQKIKKARETEANGDGGGLGSETLKGKRKATDEVGGKKKAKTPRKNQAKAADDDEPEKADEDLIKAEDDDDLI